MAELGYILGQCNQAFSWLHAKGYLSEKSRQTRTLFELTELGREQQQNGSPAHRIFSLLKAEGPKSLPALSDALALERSEIGSAFGQLSKAGAVRMNSDNNAEAIADALGGEFALVKTLLDRGVGGALLESSLSDGEKAAMAKISKKRGTANSPFKTIEREDVIWALTEAGGRAKEALLAANIRGDEVGQLTVEMMKDGSWRDATFRPYGLGAPTARIIPGRRNPYAKIGRAHV